MKVTNKVAVVTGAATGIGRDSAIRLASEGYNLYLCDWNEKELKSTVNLCLEHSVKCEYDTVDMGIESEVKRFFDNVQTKYETIDFYFNNQGAIYNPKDLDDTTIEDFDKVVHCNFKSCFLGLKYCGKIMKKQKYGKILVTGSSSGIRPETGFSVYSATKHAVVGLVKDAAVEFGRYNIRVNVVCPGGILTPLTEDVGAYLQTSGYQIPKPAQAVIHGKYGFLGSTDDITGIVSMMASTASDYMTGSVLSVDGGITL